MFTLVLVAVPALWLAAPAQSSCPIKELVELSASDGTSQNQFGWSVAISGNNLAIGASGDPERASLAGAAYVFHKTGSAASAWAELVKVTASDAATGDRFGSSIALSGDLLAVGARLSDAAGLDSGAVYLFDRNQGGANAWGEVKKLVGSDTKAGDSFGWSVALSGDTLAVGALMASTSTTGAAYVFERNQGGANNWGQVKKVLASDAALDDRFGRAVSLDGDTLLVTADGNDDAGSSSGSAYVFERDLGGANNWGERKKLVASDAAPVDHFGVDAALALDLIVVGAHMEDQGGTDSGSAYVFERDLGGVNNWGERAKRIASDSGPGNRFGRAVGIHGKRIVVGAYANPHAGFASGAAYVFDRDQGGVNAWGELERLVASDAAAGDYFGWDVATAGGFFAIGAPQDGQTSLLPGSANLFGCSAKTRSSRGEPFFPTSTSIPATSAGPEPAWLLFVRRTSHARGRVVFLLAREISAPPRSVRDRP